MGTVRGCPRRSTLAGWPRWPPPSFSVPDAREGVLRTQKSPPPRLLDQNAKGVPND